MLETRNCELSSKIYFYFCENYDFSSPNENTNKKEFSEVIPMLSCLLLLLYYFSITNIPSKSFVPQFSPFFKMLVRLLTGNF